MYFKSHFYIEKYIHRTAQLCSSKMDADFKYKSENAIILRRT